MKRFLPYLNSNRRKNVLLTIFFLFVFNSAFSATYYSKATGNANSTATWGLNTDGTGTAPGNFTTSGDVFIVRTGAALTMNGNLTFASGVTLQLIGTLTIAAPNNTNYVLTVNGTITFSGASANQLIVSTTSGNPNTSNTFALGSAATLRTANTNGVAGTNCSISTLTSGKAIVTLPTTANYEFNASAGQASTGLPTTVGSLTLSGSGTKVLPSSLTVSGNLTINGAVASISSGANYTANTLTLGTSGTNTGTWGSTSSSATYKNNTYFAATNGTVTVATVSSATPTVTVTAAGPFTYNGLAQGPNAATNSGTGSSYTFSYVGVSGTTYGPSATRPTNAGNYTATATIADSSDGFYRSASSSASAFSIAVRTLTITANNANKVYGVTQSTPVSGSTAFTSSGLQNGETIGSVTLTYGAGALAGNSVVGSTSTITPSAATSGTFTASNYAITYNSGTLTVTAAPLTITANSANKVYGTTQSTPVSGSSAFSATGLQNGESIGTVTLTYSAGALAANAVAGSTSTITPSAATGGSFVASNYSITYSNGTLTVTTAPLTITATNATKVYGVTQSTPVSGSAAFTSSGLQNGESIGSVTLSYTAGALAGNAAVGSTSTITPSAATGGTFIPSNYSITYNTGTLTVTSATLFITANNGTKVYGTTQATPVSGSTAFGSTGLQNGETIGSVTLTYGSGALAATAAVGSTSTITPSAATGGTFVVSNYNVIYLTNSGTLTVTAAPLTITANNGTKVYGATQSTPVSGSVAFSATGLQNGETIGSVTLTYGSGALAATDAVGSTSTITPSAAIGGTFNPSNYSITYTPNSGTLTVTVATLTITANDDSKTYGQTYTVGSGSTAFSSIGLENGETIGSITTASIGAVNTAAVGSYNIVPSAATGGTFTASNYAITYTNGTLTVNGASLTITANNVTKCFGDTYSSTTNFTPTGLVLGETVGSVTLTSSGSASGAVPGTYSIVPSAANGGTFTASNYSITYTDGILTVSATNVWTGVTSTAWTTASNWSCGVVPGSLSDVTIGSGTFSPEISSDVTINSLTLDSGTTLKVNASYDLTVTDVIDNDGTLTIENTANLVQVNNVANTGSGSTIVKRNSSAIMRNDYTLWSSPVSGQGVYAFSPTTLPNRFYDYNPATEAYTIVSFSLTGLQYPSPLVSGSGIGINGTDTSNLQFAPGKSYLIRAPWDHPTAPAVWNGTFSGTANNGNITYTMTEEHFNAVGNPYPSRLNFLDFVNDNPGISGTLYFWRKTNNATATSYATLNELGYVANPAAGGDTGTGYFNTGDEANWVINAGQGFFVYANANPDGDSTADLVFNNSMRRSTNSNQFFRSGQTTTAVNDGVFWLNLSNQTASISQMAVGYISDATLGVDRKYDGKNLNQDLYLASAIGVSNYAIQGRPSFVDTDVVPLTYKVTTAGNHNISIDHASGIFTTGQTIYLRDNVTAIIHDLTSGAYNFTSDAGTYASRFEILYQNQLSNPTFDANQVVVYQNSAHDFVINTGNIVMSNVKVFDIRGRMLYNSKEINATETIISTAAQANQVLLVQITSQDGLVVTKKVIR